MGFKFIKTIDADNRFSKANIEYSIPDNEMTLPELLEEFENFLRACTYHFDGKVEIVALNGEDNV